MKGILTEKDFREVLERINKLHPSQMPVWGKMNVAQMMAHLSISLEGPLGKIPFKDQGNLLSKTLIRWFSLSKKPFPRNAPTGRGLRITEQKEFEKEKQRLIENLVAFYEQGNKGQLLPHIAFGKFSPAQWSWFTYKHMDHHLNQFAV